MKRKTPLVVGNWKMNPATLLEAEKLAVAVAKNQKKATEPLVAIAPPFPFLTAVGKKIATSTVSLVAQDVSTEPLGAFTGEVSAAQLRNLGCSYVIIGHSERRAMGETDEQIQKKVLIALKNKLTPIVCIGERERDAHGNFFNFVESQIRSLAKIIGPTEIKKIVIAYEPIWAIGTGNTATAQDVKEMQLFIVSVLTKVYSRATAEKVCLLYGGSVKPNNALELHQQGEMQGFLVGGASLKAEDFKAIIKAVQQ